MKKEEKMEIMKEILLIILKTGIKNLPKEEYQDLKAILNHIINPE